MVPQRLAEFGHGFPRAIIVNISSRSYTGAELLAQLQPSPKSTECRFFMPGSSSSAQEGHFTTMLCTKFAEIGMACMPCLEDVERSRNLTSPALVMVPAEPGFVGVAELWVEESVTVTQWMTTALNNTSATVYQHMEPICDIVDAWNLLSLLQVKKHSHAGSPSRTVNAVRLLCKISPRADLKIMWERYTRWSLPMSDRLQ